MSSSQGDLEQMRTMSFLLSFLTSVLASEASFATPFVAGPQDGNLVIESLSDNLPLAFAPFELKAENFEVLIENPEARGLGLDVRILPNSTQWSRVEDYFVLPRASLKVSIPEGWTGTLQTARRVTPLFSDSGGRGQAVALVSLVQSSASDVVLEIQTKGRIVKTRLLLKPVAQGEKGHLVFDISCSRRKLDVSDEKIPSGEWVYVACRPQEVGAEFGKAQVQDFYILWSGPVAPLQINSNTLSSLASQPLQLFEVNASSGATRWWVQHGEGQFRLDSFASPETHRGNFAMALGAYNANFSGGGQSSSGLTELTSLYASYLFSETTRLIYFAEIEANPQLFSDWGVYFELETAKALDRRISFNLMLGFHGAAFFSSTNASGSNLSYNGHIDAPQGFEIVYTDPHRPLQSLSAGAFIEPSININSYYNLWLRWNRTSYFVEVNYLSWVQSIDQLYSSSAVGVSVGIPLIGFW